LAAGNEAVTTEEAVRGFIRAALGAEIKVRVIGGTCGIDVKAGVIRVVHGTIVEDRDVGVAIGLSVSTMQVVRPCRGVV
jgi:hypothetical protein